jgi:hypothetical protein
MLILQILVIAPFVIAFIFILIFVIQDYQIIKRHEKRHGSLPPPMR